MSFEDADDDGGTFAKQTDRFGFINFRTGFLDADQHLIARSRRGEAVSAGIKVYSRHFVVFVPAYRPAQDLAVAVGSDNLGDQNRW